MNALNISKKLESGAIRTARARMAWPFLEKPDNNRVKKGKNGNEKHVYKVALFFPPDADIAALKQAANDAAVEEFGAEKVQAWIKAGKWNSPFRDGRDASRTERNPDGWAWADGHICIRADTDTKPQVLEANGHDIGDDYAAVYGGRWCRATLNAKAYPAIDGGKPGVKFYLSNVQLLDHDERLGGGRARAEDEFDAVEIAGSDGSADAVFGGSEAEAAGLM